MSADLFDFPPPAGGRTPRRPRTGGPLSSPPCELRAARALARRIKRAASRDEKKRLGHLICLNLAALCRARTRGLA